MSSSSALITGASRGIGRAIALALAREGFNIAINYATNTAAAQEVQRQVESAGVRAVVIQADISSAADRQRLADEAWSAFGRIDLLINNAGIAPSARADLLEAGEESFDRLMSTNLKGPYFLTQLIAKKMIQAQPIGPVASAQSSGPVASAQSSGSPKIINITSVSAYAASTNRGDYCIAKAGLSMMTKLYAARLAEYGINVYEIRPGIIETDMTGPVKAKYDKLIMQDDLTPIRRWGKPEDVARAVVAIAKDFFAFSTGEVINVDGGFHLRRL